MVSLTAWVSAQAGAASRSYDFEVLLDGKPIGTHTFEVDAQAGSETIRSAARFDVKVLGIRLYRYQHEAQESWRDGCLDRITASTDDNGSRLLVRGARGQAGFQLEQPAGAALREGCVTAFAYWDRDRLLRQRELLNPQTGKFDAVRFESLGEERIESGGTTVLAQRHRLLGEDLRIDLWYSPGGEWLQLESPARGKRVLRYRLRN